MTEPKKRGRWKPGQSGNPNGRPPGTGHVAKLRASIAVLAAVSSGDLAPEQAARLLSAIGALARVAEIDELTDRIEKLEELRHANP